MAEREENAERTQVEPLPFSRLAWSCPAEWLPFESTAELTGCSEDMGQARAVSAIRVALRLRSRGYNVFAAGTSGTGRTRTARGVVRAEAESGPVPNDVVYVANFEDPRSPRLLRVPAGTGRRLARALEEAERKFLDALAAMRASSAHRRRRQSATQRHHARQAELLGELQEKVRHDGFALVELDLGNHRQHALAPIVEGKPVSMEELEGLRKDGKVDEGAKERFQALYPDLAAQLSDATARVREVAREQGEELARVDREAAGPAIADAMDEIRTQISHRPGEHAGLDRYLGSLERYLHDVVPALFAFGERFPSQGAPAAGVPDPLAALAINVVVDHADTNGQPVVEEPHPDPLRLLGYVDPQPGPRSGTRSDVTRIRAGALMRADGGYLLVNAHDLLTQEGAWEQLRRVLRAESVGVLPGDGGVQGQVAPESMPLDVTVVLIGTPALRAEFVAKDPEFEKLFKIAALFEDHVPLSEKTANSYACFLAQVLRQEELAPHDASAVARLLEQMVRSAGGRERLSTNFRLFTDLARESTLIARSAGDETVTGAHIEEAIDARRARAAFLSQRIQDAFRDGLLQVDLEGGRIGQVNALAVVHTTFGNVGYPVRITATAAVGSSGIIDIEREAELSGEIHTKASLILAGFLRSRFAQRFPLAVTSSICFEQSYGGVDGDSASCAELASLLSALAEVEIRQDIAVTGAVDQHGQVLAVGGVVEKIEGFWTICRQQGLKGTEGVIIPAASAPSLQLDPRVVDDVRGGRFSIYAVRTVDELMQVLAGRSLGVNEGGGKWPKGSLGRRVADRLQTMAESLREFGASWPE